MGKLIKRYLFLFVLIMSGSIFAIQTIKVDYKPSNPNFKIKLDKVLTILGEDDENDSRDYVSYFSKAPSFDVDNNGNIYVLEADEVCILKFNNKGEFICRIGEKGNGPGDMLNPQSICISNNLLYVNDMNYNKSEIFNLDGKFVKNIFENKPNISQPFIMQKFGDNFVGATVIASINKEKQSADLVVGAGIVDKDLNLKNNLTIKNLHLSKNMLQNPYNEVCSFSAVMDILYTAPKVPGEYKINIFDKKCNLLTVLRRNCRKIKNSKEYIKNYKKRMKKNISMNIMTDNLIYQPSIKGLVADGNKALWVYPAIDSKKETNESISLDIYEKNVFINRVKLDIPNIDKTFFSTSVKIVDGKLYILDKHTPAIKIFKIKYL